MSSTITRSSLVSALAALCALAPAIASAQVVSYAYVPNTGSGTVSVIDTRTRAVVATVLAVGTSPEGIAPTPDGARVYISVLTDNVVRPIDLVTGTVGAAIPVGSTPVGLAVLRDGSKVYVANLNSATVSVISTATNTVVATIPTGTGPISVAVSPNGQRVYVTNYGDDSVTVIDPVTDTVVGTPLPSPGTPAGVVVSADGQRLYVGNFNAAGVNVIDVALGTVLTTIPVGVTPTGPSLSPDGSRLAIANFGSDSVSVINTATNTVVATPGTGDGPYGAYYTPDGATIYTINYNANSVTVLDATTFAVLATIPVGNFPYSLTSVMTPPILSTACGGCGALTIAGDGDLTPLGVRAHVIFNTGLLRLTGPWTTTRNLSFLANGGTIDTQGFAASVSGSITNNGTLTKTGVGTLTIAGANHGGTVVQQGTLIVNGNHAPAVDVQGGVLGGNGSVTTATVALGAIAPGANGPGILTAGAVSMAAGSSLVVQLNGAAAGTGYDRLAVTGTATLNNPTLSVQLGYAPASGTVFTILTHATGTFAGLPQGATFTAGGTAFHISYTAGGGSDVALVVDLPPTITGPGDQTVQAGTTPAPIPFTVGDDVTAAGALVVTASSSNQALLPNGNIVLGGSGAARTLTAAPVAGASGSTVITLAVSDGFQITQSTFTLTVTALPVSFLSEGATGPFFSTDLLLANPNAAAAPVVITFFKDDGTTVVQNLTLPAMARRTVRVGTIAGMESAAFSTRVVSTSGVPVVVERTMWWDTTGYGAHTEKASSRTASDWFFAEGSQGFFSTYFLLQNPNPVATVAHVTYFLESGATVSRDYPLLPSSRRTIDAGSDAALVNRSFGARVHFDLPGMAERAMYFGAVPLFSGGHASAGVTAPSPTWLLAEGATGSFFDTFVLIANPDVAPAAITMTYLPSSGVPITRTHTVAAGQRLTINVATEAPALASAAVSIQVDADRPVVAERSQYWPVGAWQESHNSAGETAPGMRWGLAEGRVGGANNAQTYILIANPGALAATITATFLRETGAPVVKTFTVAPRSRFNIAVTGPGSVVPELTNEAFGAVISSTQPVLVERSLYADAGGVVWAAGTNATGTRLP